MSPKRFRETVLRFYKKEGRHTLPWRKTRDPYRILVSEIMLQQTQVERVIPFYERFIARFPTVSVLAGAPLKEVLVLWQGLGYNRRAKMLHEAAKEVRDLYKGKVPTDPLVLETLPGIGHYTARAVAAFSNNSDVVFIETNIRTALIHSFFPGKEGVHDRELMLLLEKVLRKGESRIWYAALMDYGAALKRSGIRINQKSAGYKKQSAFKGSKREVRGALLRALVDGEKTSQALIGIVGKERKEAVLAQLTQLHAEGLIEKKSTKYRLPS